MIPIITSLINSLQLFDDSNNLYEEEYDNETITSDSEESLTNQQTEVNYNNITEVLENVKKNIYISLKYYWAVPDEFGIMAALLDPRYKNLNFISDNNIKKRIHSNLKAEYDQLKLEINQQSTPSSPITTLSTGIENLTINTKSLREHQAKREQRTKKVFQTTENITPIAEDDEINTYFLLLIVRENKNSLDW